MTETIFTKIINRDIPAAIIYEDEVVIAFLTIQPVHPGHTLVVPKTPFVNILDGDDDSLAQMMKIAQKIAKAIVNVTAADGINIIMNNGKAAGQEVFHAHLHVIPRFDEDGSMIAPKHIEYGPGEAETVASKLSAELS